MLPHIYIPLLKKKRNTNSTNNTNKINNNIKIVFIIII